MGEVNAEQFCGFLVPDHRFLYSAVAAKGAGATDSDYTQAGPRAGVPVEASGQTSEMVLVATGDQSADGQLEVRTQRAGLPGLENGSFLWRDVAGGDGTDDYYGHDGYQLVTGWESLYHTTTGSQPDAHLDALRLASGKVLVAGVTSTSGLSLHILRRYDPAGGSGAGAWSSLSVTQADWQSQDGPALCQITEGRYAGRVLLFLAAGSGGDQVDAYYSDDEGETWALAAYRVLPTTTAAAIRQLSAAYNNGAILLLAQSGTGGGAVVEQFASSDLGARFDAVTTTWGSVDPEAVDVAAIPGGGWLVAVQDAANGKSYTYRTGSAWSPITDELTDDLAANSAPASNCGISVWYDEDGTAWMAYLIASRQVRLDRSTDNGDNWVSAANQLWNEGSGEYPYRFAATATGGRGLWVTRWSSSSASTDPMSVGVAYLGGHSQHTAPVAASGQGFFFDLYVGFGEQIDPQNPGHLYLPFTVPGSLSTWTAAGSGSEAITSNLENEITTSAAQRYYTGSGNDGDIVAFFGEIRVEVDDGDGDSSTKQIAWQVRISDYPGSGSGTYEYEVSVRIDSAGYRLFDENGAEIGSEQALDFTEAKHIRLALDNNGAVRVWYGSGGQDRAWTLSHSSAALTDAGAGTNGWRVFWGHIATTTSASRWTLVGGCFWAYRWGPTSEDLVGSEWTNPDDLRGRDWPTRPALLTDGVLLEARSGPSYNGETWTITTDYDYPLSAAFPEIASSPRLPWRSTADGVDAHIVLDMDAVASKIALDNTTVCLALFGANVSSALLQGYNGSSWVTLGTASATAGWSSLDYLRTGPTVQVNTAGAVAGPYLNHNEHVGDTVDLGSSKLRRIARNTSGAWTNTETKRPTLQLDSELFDDSEPASGKLSIWRQDFAVVIHELTTDYELLRIKIPAHSTADGYYEIGSWYLGPVEVMGTPPDFQISERRIIPQTISRRRDGASRARAEGPQRRRLEIGWGENIVDPWRTLTSSPAPDYVVGSSNGKPIATPSDTARVMEGLRERLRGAEVPAVWLGRFEQVSGATTEQLTNGRYFYPVRMETDITREVGPGDRWGVDETERIDRVTLVEEV